MSDELFDQDVVVDNMDTATATHFPVGDSVLNLITVGRAQARQIAHLGRWLSQHGQRVMAVVGSRQDEEPGLLNGITFLAELLNSLDEDALLEIFQIILGVDEKFAEKYFDVAVLLDAAILVYQEHPSVRKLLDRFFFMPNSAPIEKDSSTISDAPMDGQTMLS